jgi:DNA polymerase I
VADKLYLVDGHAFAFRAFYAIRHLTNSKGEPTNAAFGFARVLLRLMREENPTHLAVVFDAPGKTFRDDLYPDYKATREAMPDDLRVQIPVLEEIVDAFDLKKLVVPNVEADDVIGTLARIAEEQGMEAVLVTGDKDILQCITDKVKVYDPNKGENGQWYGIDEVKERFGVGPEHVIDALGLMGDSSDNVPGVKGIGPKSAKTLLEKYGTMEGIYEHIDELKGKQKERLVEEKDMAFLSRQLVTIDKNVDLDIAPADCTVPEFNREKLAALFHKLEFKTLTEEFLPDAKEEEAPEYTLLLTGEAIRAALKEMETSGTFAVDTETTSTDQMRAKLVGVSMSCNAGTGYYVPIAHTEESFSSRPEGVPKDAITGAAALELLRPILENPDIGKIGHNIKYDLVVLERAGVKLAGITLDTMVASYLTDPSRLRHNLDEVSLHYLNRKLIPISELIGKGSKQQTFDTVPIEQACTYAAEDADITWRLAEVFQPKLREQGVEQLFKTVELPLIGVLARMEQAGIALDLELFGALSKEVKSRLDALEAEIHDLAGEPFQINSPKQLQAVLFDKLGLKPIRKTKTGYSTDVEVLERLVPQHPLPEKILEYRMLEKLRGTYIETLPKLVHPETGRLHTSFNQAVAATGRLSSSDPNLQNIPVRTEMGRRIREGFVPGGKNRRLISADYSQIELRILAHLSGDAGLIEAFEQDEDIHRDTAARVFGVIPETVTPEMRRQAKAVNFGVVYGISAFGLARNLGIGNSEAQQFIDQYFATYPGVRDWIDKTLELAKKDGYVTTLLNRRRYVPELRSGTVNTRKAGERIAINTPVQGSAADIIKVAMIRLDEALADTDAQLLLQVHDELLVECPKKDAKRVGDTMRAIMEEAFELRVPLKVDVGIGDNWESIH